MEIPIKEESQGKFDLQSSFSPCGDQPAAIETLVKNFKAGAKYQTLLGVTGSGKTFTVANVISKLQKKVLVLAPNKTLAAQLYGEFKEFFPNNAVEYFVSYYDYYQPEAYVTATDTYIEKDSAINDEIDRLRHSATRNLLERSDVIVVASVSCIYSIGDKDDYLSHKIDLMLGDKMDRDTLIEELVKIQYTRNEMDLSRGTFRVRGESVDIFLPYEDRYMLRVTMSDEDEIESISQFDPLRNVFIRKLNQVSIFPSSHYVVGEEKMKRAMLGIKEELRARLKEFEEEEKLVEKQRLSQRTLLDLEMLEEMGMCPGIENYSLHLTGRSKGETPPTLIDFFDKNFLMVIDESHIAIPQVGGMFAGDRSRKQNLVDHGFRLPSALDNRPLQFPEFEERLDQVLYVSATPSDFELKKTSGEFVEQLIRPTGLLDPEVEVRNAETQVEDLLEEAKKAIGAGHRVLVTTLTKKLAEELTSYYQGVGMKVKYLHSDIDTIERIEILNELREGVFDILVGINLLREGLDLPEVALIGILDADKEGFLRSTRSLIQTIGRAARNSEGRVILYAYKETLSIKEALKESRRRRQIQMEYNEKMGIVPKTIKKKIQGGVIEALKKKDKASYSLSLKKAGKKNKSLSDPKLLDQRIETLKKKMKEAAKLMRYEEAATYRDEIKELSDLRVLL